MKISQSIFCIAAISLCVFGVSISAAKAAEYPGDRPITLVVPFAAGGPTDKVARELVLAKWVGNSKVTLLWITLQERVARLVPRR